MGFDWSRRDVSAALIEFDGQEVDFAQLAALWQEDDLLYSSLDGTSMKDCMCSASIFILCHSMTLSFHLLLLYHLSCHLPSIHSRHLHRVVA